MKKTIALFGLSANPPTGLSGHQGIVRYLVEMNRFDEVWILPVYRHILKEMGETTPTFEDRFNMCQECFTAESSSRTEVIVQRIEKELFDKFPPNTKIGTIDVLEHIKATFPDINEVYLTLGKDTFQDLALGKWKRHDDILALSSLLVIERDEFNNHNEQNPVFQEFLLKHKRIERRSICFPITGVSSSRLRVEKPWKNPNYFDPQYIHPQVISYIRSHSLYM